LSQSYVNTRCAYVDKYFSLLYDVKIEIMHSIAPINVHSSIIMWVCPNVCPMC